MLNYVRHMNMNKKEFMHSFFADALDAYISAEAKFSRIVRCIADYEKEIVSKKIIGKQYLAKNIISDDYYSRGINKDMMMKAVAVDVSFPDTWSSPLSRYNLMYIHIGFLGDPDDILKMGVTSAEKKILSELNHYYKDRYFDGGLDSICDLNSSLRDLKHHYNIAYKATWTFDAEAILSEDFFIKGFKCGITSL